MDRRVSLTISALLVLGVATIIFWPHPGQAPTTNVKNGVVTQQQEVDFSTADIPESLQHFSFSTKLPAGWIGQFDQGNTMMTFSPLTAGQGDSGDTVVTVTRMTGSVWPSTTGGTFTATTIKTYPAHEWSGLTVTSAWHDRFDGWHRGEPIRQTDIQVQSGTRGVYYRLTGGPGVSDTEWRTIQDHLQLSTT